MTQPQPITPPHEDDELKAFLLVFRQGMLLINSYIEKKYNIERKLDRRQRCNCEREDLHKVPRDEAA